MSTSPEVVKWFTRARRFPQLIGRTPDGARIPGGPYTVTQVVGAGIVLFAGTRTMSLWARYGLLSNAMILLSVAFAVVWGLGRIPVGSRNPLSVSTGLLRALSTPPTGRVGGRPVRLRRPHQVRHRIVVLQPALPALPVAAPETAALPVHVAGATQAAAPTPASARPTAAVRHAKRLRRPHTVTREQARASAALPTPAVPAPRPAPALTAVQALLAQASTSPAPVAALARQAARSRLEDL